jgi:hypothetical protein
VSQFLGILSRLTKCKIKIIKRNFIKKTLRKRGENEKKDKDRGGRGKGRQTAEQ